MRYATLSLPLILMGAIAACEKKPEAAQDAVDAAPAELTDEAVDQAEIPVKEDFEEEAYAAINEDNVEAELDALEKEIQGDSP